MHKLTQLFQTIESQFEIKLSDNQKRAIQSIIENSKQVSILGDAQLRLLFELPKNEIFSAEEALKIAESKGISRASTFRLLSRLERVSHGYYRVVV